MATATRPIANLKRPIVVRFRPVTSAIDESRSAGTAGSGSGERDSAASDRGGRGAGSVGSFVLGAATLVVVGAVVPLAIAHHYDALRIPRSDDWSYLRALIHWRHTGHLDFNHWVSMTLIAQLILARPVIAIWNDSITATRVLTAALGVVGLGAIVAMAPSVGVSRRRGLLVAVALAACPLWGPLASTFMTEVPAFCFEMLCLWCACAGWSRRPEGSAGMPAGFLVGTAALGFVAIAVRQYAAVTVAGVLLAAIVAAWAGRDRRALRDALVVTGVLVVATLALLVWWSHVPNLRALTPETPSGISYKDVVRTSGGFLRLAGLMMLPPIVLAGPVRIVRRAWSASRVLSVMVAALTLLVLVVSDSSDLTPARKSAFVGNYFDPRGVLADDITYGTRPRIMAKPLFGALTLIASVAGLLLAIAVVPFLVTWWTRWRGRTRGRGSLRTFLAPAVADAPRLALGLNVVGFAVAYEIAVLFKFPIWDRYALPALPLVGLLALGSRAASSRRASFDYQIAMSNDAPEAGRGWRVASLASTGVALLLIGWLGIVYSAESASFDATRWHVAEAAVRAGWPAVDVAPGYEWIGWQPGLQRAILQESTEQAKIAERRAYESGLCVQIIVNPPARPHRPVVAVATSVGLMRKPIKIYAVRWPMACNKPPKPGTPGATFTPAP